MDFTVATFNLRTEHGRDGENAWPARSERVAALLRDSGALIVGTQEGSLRMLTDLAERLPGCAFVGQGRRGGGEDEHCAIFHRLDGCEVEEAGDFWLSTTPDLPGSSGWDSSLPRMCTWARFHLPSGRRLTVYNTHLDHVGQEARQRGIRLICDRLRARRAVDGLPALLMGDLNSDEESPVVRYLRGQEGGEGPELTDAFRALPPGTAPGATFHGFRGGSAGSPIDYIFGTAGVTFRSTRVLRTQHGGGHPSDHYPVLTTVRLV